MSRVAYLLFAHGARDPDWAQPLNRLADAVRLRAPEAAVQLAFLEFMQPDLATAIDQLVAGQAATIHIVPVFLAAGGHVKRDLPAMLDAARSRHPSVRIELEAVLGESAAVIAAMAEQVVGG